MTAILLATFMITLLFWLRNPPPNGKNSLTRELKVAIFLQAASAALAVAAMYWCAMRQEPEPFTTFSGGNPGISGLPKSFEYRAQYLGLMVLPAVTLLLQTLYRYLLRHPGRQQTITRLSWYSLLPAAVMIGQSITFPDGALLGITALAVILPLPAALWAADGGRTPETFRAAAEKLYGGILLTAASLTGIVLLSHRVVPLPGILPPICAAVM
ncbi:MAG: hypothetical protein PHQ27_08330, partial [Victivallales bacterium]|nr:hypothetical protein [Victivallales bacterium]